MKILPVGAALRFPRVARYEGAFMKVYFDRNVFGDIKRKLEEASSTHPDLALLQQAVDDGRLTVLLSLVVLEETYPSSRHSSEMLTVELQTISRLVQHRRMIKLGHSLLNEAVQSYAFDRRLPDMFTKPPREVTDFLTKGEVTPVLKEFMEATERAKESFVKRLDSSFADARRKGEERNIGRPESFQEFWNGMAPLIGRLLAERYGVENRCLERGIEGLLENRTVKLYANYYAGFVHSKWFGEQGAPGKVIGSERADFFHSVQASAADVFVTGDGKLTRRLKQVPIEGFEVITLPELFERLQPVFK